MIGTSRDARARRPEYFRERNRNEDRAQRANPSVPQTCTGCGVDFMASRNRNRNRFCSPECQYAYKGAYQSALGERDCSWCGAQHSRKGSKFCSSACRRTVEEGNRLRMRGPLLAAWEDGDHGALISEVKSRCTIDDNGCWIWTGRGSAGKKGGELYPVVKMGGFTKQVHRITLEAKMGRPLGSQSAHHTCAIPLCCNPTHLQPATHAENILEMLQRQAYLARIRELEAALVESDPEHPLLTMIPCL